MRTNLGCHLSIIHEIFEGKATEIKLETNKEETNYEANARKVKKCKLCNLCGKTFQNYSLLKTHIEKVHDQKVVGYAALNEINNLELGLQVFKYQNCDKMCVLKRHSKLHEVKNMVGNFYPKVSSSFHCCGKDFSSYQELSGVINEVKKSLECCNCELKIAIEILLREHLLKKHGKLSLVEVIPDRGKLDSHKPKVTNVESSSIQVMMASCEKCSCTLSRDVPESA